MFVAVAAVVVLWSSEGSARAASNEVSLASPDGAIQIRFSLSRGAHLSFDIAFRGKAIIETSPLAMILNGTDLGDDVTFGKPDRYRVNQRYPWHGVHSLARDHCNGARIPIRRLKLGTGYTLEARAYDDGVAFRWIVPGAPAESRVPDEGTLFRIPAGSTVWYHDFEGHYEGVHAKKAVEAAAAEDWAAPPLTFKLPGDAGYASITEGALFAFSGMGLQADGNCGFYARLGHAIPPSYPFRLRFAEDVARMAQPASVSGTITTPWRIVMIGADLNTLVNCDIVHNVAPPPDERIFPRGINTDWIRPGRAVWKYLDGGENTLDHMREFSRLAGELGFEYNLVEGFWQKWTEQELKDFVRDSRQHGVGIWLWKHSKEVKDPAGRRRFFQLCRDAGVVGLKLDFFDHESKDVVEMYEACLRDAADFRLMVNFHGANKPTGESRTWPNELTREGIRGMEARRILRAEHDATLPFTRMLAGHADYTPVHFGERRNDTTWAHQVASAAIFTSPLLVIGAHPANILKNPCAEMVKSIPSVWDETIALPVSEIGRVAAFARRRGSTWFLAVMNGASARTIRVPLSFLGGGNYKAMMVRDHPEDPAAVQLEDSVVSSAESLAIDLRAGGGFIARFVR
ncbi:MAG: glycoside hydrolase family 97 N-terminal domain-containing protein [Acidobacteria bacterium]|nr:glycoside hydrolase family 97 N-terminal domain-containing protein [Acidobacteriota bacterium]